MSLKPMALDSHWHVYSHLDHMGRDYRIAIDEYQKNNNLRAINICSIPIYNDLGPEQNILAALYKLHNPTAYAFGGLVYPQKPFKAPMPQGTDPRSQYEELMEIGFDGIKVLETKPYEQKQYGMHIDDPYFDPIFAACEHDGTPMIWHVADPGTFWDLERIPKRFLDRGWYYGDGTYMSYEQMYDQVLHVLQKHPQLKVTFAHFFFWSEKPEALAQLFETYPGVSVDLTPGAEMYADFRENREYYREFFVKYADRILFGTDTSFNGTEMQRFTQRSDAVRDFVTTDDTVTVIVETCSGLKLPEDAAQKILYQNFEAAAGARPKKANKEALQRYFEKYRPYIKDTALLQFFEAELC